MSEPFLVQDLLSWTGGRLDRGEPSVSLGAVSTDTRSLPAETLFIAIRGPRHDAHDHLASAIEQGAKALLVEHTDSLPPGADLPVVVVPDTTQGLGAIAAGHRLRFHGPVVAITGSNGKTTTKEMCAAILELSGPCLKNRGNLNNEFGLPLTLLERNPEHQTLVVEIGMNHRGEIAPLTAIAQPTIGVITNVGSAHIEHLGSQEEIALEKGDLIAALPADAIAILNADDPRVLAQASRTAARVITFGRGPDADLQAQEVVADENGSFAFDLVWERKRHEVRVAGLGEPTVLNALAAAAAALAAGSTLPEVVRGLLAYGGVPGRMARIDLPKGRVVIDDTYNANPQSTAAALESLGRLAGAQKGWAALGSMGELGATAAVAHQELGRLAARLQLRGLFALGQHASDYAEGAVAGGMAEEDVHVTSNHEELAELVLARMLPGEWILVKGSRAMEMERIVARLTESSGEEA